MKISILVGSGDKIALFTLPFIFALAILNLFFPGFFYINDTSGILKMIANIFIIPGLILWLWSVYLVLNNVPNKKLITHGPYLLVKHPLYTSVALLVLPSVGILFNSWLGVFFGLFLYIGSRLFSPL
ncbi:MAG: hypothetical protein LWX83_07125, partial [Anaerolineae bacterium]|nr:hypothetical protein [Anaerolineae bacterium]